METQRRIRAYEASELMPFTELLRKGSATIIAALLLGVSCAAAEPQKKRLAVLDFEYGLVRKQAAAIFGTEVDVGRGMRDLMLKHLVQDGTYTIVELKALDKMLAQQGLAPSDRASALAATRIGRILGVDAVVMGTITQFGGEIAERKIGLFGVLGASGTQELPNKVRAVVAVDARVVNIDSGEVVAVSEGRGESKRMGTSLLAGVFRAGSLDVGTMDFSSRDFEKTILGEAVKTAAEQLAAGLVAVHDKVRAREMPVEGLVVLVEGERVVLNMGSRAGLKVGDRLPVERPGQEVKDPATGKVIRRMRQPIGMVEIAEVHEESADGRVVSGSGFEVGDVAGTGKMTASGPATEILTAILTREMAKRKAARIIDEDEEIKPSGADLRIGRTIFIQPMPYDLHLRMAAALRELADPLFILTENRKEADLWMRGTAQYEEQSVASGFGPNEETKRVLVRRLAASVVIVPRGGSQPLWSGEAKGSLEEKEKIAKALVKKLRKSLGRK